MTVAERLGWTLEDIDIRYRLDAVQRRENAPKRDDLIPTTKWETPLDRGNVALAYYLMDDHANARMSAMALLADAIDFFFGPWRTEVKPQGKPVSLEFWRRKWTWIAPFRIAMCWGSTIEEWTSLTKIAGYPDDDCPVDVGYKQEDKDLWLAAACYLKRGPNSKYQAYIDRVTSGTKKAARLLVACLAAICAGSSETCTSALAAYLAHACKTELRRPGRPTMPSIDGTFLYHLGTREGLKIDLSDAHEDLIIRLVE